MTTPFRRTAATIALAVLISACGGDTESAAPSTTTSSTTTTTTAATTTTSTTVAETTTTVDRGPLGALTTAPVEDPFGVTGFVDMTYSPEGPDQLISVEPFQGTQMLSLAPADSIEATGVGDGQVLVFAFVQDAEGDVSARGTVLYSLGVNGWGVYAAITGTDLLTFLETTTDYLVKKPNGPATAVPNVHTFDWAGGAARFEGDVAVVDETESTVFEGSFACELTSEFSCELTSDDGVLRPDDEGEAVEALQRDLETLGYFTDPIDGIYAESTIAAVRLFQRDYRLTQDGRAGPQTLGLLIEVALGESEIVLASMDGVGPVPFGEPAALAIGDLAVILGAPDETTGWYVDACIGNQWNQATWGGFTAIFTEDAGNRTFSGWKVTDLTDLPDWLYFAGGIAPGWTWQRLERLGAGFEPNYSGFWYLDTLGYNNGRFVDEPGDAPAPDAAVKSFGTGTGAFVSC